MTGADEDLARRLRRVEDQLAIERTMARYAHAIDYGDEAGWVDCFTEDAAFEVRSRWAEPAPKRIEGRAALARFVARHSRAPLSWHKHVVWAIVVDLDDDTFEPPPDTLSGPTRELVVGTFKLDGRLMLALDVNQAVDTYRATT